MSLFQTKEWWNTRISGNEEFDDKHLLVANIDNNPQHQDRIVVGSFQGFLRIYAPKKGEFSIDDMIFEQNFNEPIIQVGCGYYSPNAGLLLLSVLFFKKLCIFECETTPDQRINLKKTYVCNLPRNAYNMCQGNFGGSSKDQICVQSCDGLLMIIESDQVTAGVQLQEFLLPSPISYNSATDQIVLQNSSYEIEAYKISNIGAVSNSNGTKKLLPDWTLNIGEQCLKLESVCRDHKVFDFISLTEEALFVITQTGQIRTQKRFDYPAANFYINEIPEKHAKAVLDPLSQQPLRVISLIITSFTHHLMIYEDFQLLWATKTDHVCHGVGVGTFQGQRGLLVGLNDEGWLNVSYLGTEPPLNQMDSFAPLQGQNLTINQISDMYEVEFQKINQLESKQPVKKADVSEVMNINIQVSAPIPAYDYVQDEDKYYKFDNGQVKCVKVSVNLQYTGVKASDVIISLILPPNLEVPANKMPHSVQEIVNSYQYDFPIYVLKSFNPSASYVEILVSYHNSAPGKQANRDPRNSVGRIELPCGLQCHLAVPIKNANYKLNFNTSLPCENILDVFKDVVDKCPNQEECLQAPNTYTFEYSNGNYGTILCSKQGDKYRIQSSTFEGIYFIMLYFFQKIKKYQEAKKKVADITFTEVVTFQDFFTVVDAHYLLRHKLLDNKELLEKKATEFRTIQKRLLTRFKEKNPAPINNLDILMQKSFDDLIQLGNKHEKIQEQLNQISNNLSITVKLILWLFKIRFNLSSETMFQLENAISSDITGDEDEIGWEEITNANVIYLLKVVMKKEMKETHLNIQKIDDFAKFKKNLTFVFDKISKGQLEKQ
ncbi:hypothetical protein ABPG74_002050 [Tetrahymena malaccensis]